MEIEQLMQIHFPYLTKDLTSQHFVEIIPQNEAFIQEKVMRNPEIAEINKALSKIPIKHLRIGVVNFGRPAPGINNVIEGLL